MRRVLAYLSEERHHLQARGAAGAAELEANGKAIAAMQAQLVNALARPSGGGR